MSKKKSVVLLVIYTLLIAALCFICTVSFSYGTDNLYTFSSVMRMMEKDADLGIAYGANADAFFNSVHIYEMAILKKYANGTYLFRKVIYKQR